MILAYRTETLRPYSNDPVAVVVELRWFDSENDFHVYADKWRGDRWHLVETNNTIEKRDANS